MTLPVIGFGKDADVRIDLAALLERRLLVQSGSGGGKSTLIRSFAEELAGKVQQFVVDTEGDLVTLREAGDFVIVGSNGDVPADVKTVKVLARRLMELGASAIFDLSGLNVTGRREYVQHLFDELSYMPRALWHPLVVWLDEGHVFAPQSESAISGSAVANAAATWRKRGYCLVVATQRLSKLNKDVAAELHNKLIGFTDDVDLKRAADQLGMTTDQARELQDLPPGAFYAKGPSLSRVRVLVHARDPKTSPPPKGQIRTEAPPAPEKVRAILGKLADLAREAKEELHSIEDLRRAVAERDREIRRLKKGGVTQTVEKPVVDQAAIAREVQRAVQATTRANAQSINALRKALEAAMKFIINVSTQNFDVAGVDKEELERAIGAAVVKATDMVERRLATRQQQIDSLRLAAGRIAAQLKAALGDEETVINVEVAKNEPFTVSAPSRAEPKRKERASVVATIEGVTPSMQRILNALASFEQLGIRPAKRVNVAFFAGYTENGHFNNMCGTLRTAGLLDYPQGGMLELTDAGRAVADSAAHPIDSLQQLHEAWLSKVSPSEGKLLSEIISRYPEEISRAELASIAGYTENGHFNNMLGHLRSLGAIDYPRGAHVVATDVLFPEGLN